MSDLITLTETNFETEVLQATVPVLVDFWAAWCGPCRLITPILEDLAKDMGEKVKIGKVNVDENGGLARQFGIQSIPTLLFFKNGELVHKQIGLTQKPQLKAAIEKLV
jgi:thioredoxin 1